MKRRRDPFARESYIPELVDGECWWCPDTRRAYRIRIEPDSGRETYIKGRFCSWTCAESYHNTKIGG
mgnify:FL=1